MAEKMPNVQWQIIEFQQLIGIRSSSVQRRTLLPDRLLDDLTKFLLLHTAMALNSIARVIRSNAIHSMPHQDGRTGIVFQIAGGRDLNERNRRTRTYHFATVALDDAHAAVNDETECRPLREIHMPPEISDVVRLRRRRPESFYREGFLGHCIFWSVQRAR